MALCLKISGSSCPCSLIRWLSYYCSSMDKAQYFFNPNLTQLGQNNKADIFELQVKSNFAVWKFPSLIQINYDFVQLGPPTISHIWSIGPELSSYQLQIMWPVMMGVRLQFSCLIDHTHTLATSFASGAYWPREWQNECECLPTATSLHNSSRLDASVCRCIVAFTWRIWSVPEALL